MSSKRCNDKHDDYFRYYGVSFDTECEKRTNGTKTLVRDSEALHEVEGHERLQNCRYNNNNNNNNNVISFNPNDDFYGQKYRYREERSYWNHGENNPDLLHKPFIPDEIDLVSDEEVQFIKHTKQAHGSICDMYSNGPKKPKLNINLENSNIKDSNCVNRNNNQCVSNISDLLKNDVIRAGMEQSKNCSNTGEYSGVLKVKEKDKIKKSTPKKDVRNSDATHKQPEKILNDVSKIDKNIDSQINLSNELKNIQLKKNPYVLLEKIDSMNNSSISKRKLQFCKDLQSNAINNKKIRLTEKPVVNTNIKVSNTKSMNSKKNCNTQVEQQHGTLQNNLTSDILENPIVHKKKFIRNPVKQLKYTLLLMNEKLKENYRVQVLSNVKPSKKIYDALFAFAKENHSTKSIDLELCITKYLLWKEYDSTPTINLKMLKSRVYNIKKYYNRYRRIAEESSSNMNIKNLFIYTNLELNYSSFEKKEINIIEGSKPNGYKLVVNEKSEIFQNLLKKSIILPVLAKQIADHIITKEPIIVKGLIKKYHVALIYENVIKISTKVENGKKKSIGKFHQKFIKGDNISISAKDLREHLEIRLGRPVSEDMELNLSGNFGKDFIFDENPHISKTDKLAKELATVICLSINMPKEKILFRKYSALKEDISKITGHILKKGNNDTVVFTKQFLNSKTKLPGNLNLVRNLIKRNLQEKNINFDQITQCKLKMNEFRDKELAAKKLPRENYCKMFIREFFNKLEFVINKTDIDKRICQEIGEEFKLVQDKSCVDLIQEEFLNWAKLDNYSLNPFELIKYKISKFIIMNLWSKCNLHLDSNIQFQQKCLNEIKDCLNDSNVKFINIKTNSMHLTKQKIYQITKDIPKYAENDGCLFINYDIFITESHHVLNAFKSPSTYLLVIEYDANRNLEYGDHVLNICYELKNIIDLGSKKLLLIGNTNYIVSNIKLIPKVINDAFNNLINLTQDSQNYLLKNIDVQIHHRRLKLFDIMDNTAFLKFITVSKMLSKLIKEKFILLKDLLIPTGFDNNYYIHNQVNYSIIINPIIFKENNNNVFIVSGIDKLDFSEFVSPREKVCYLYEISSYLQSNARFILVDHTYTENSFEKLVEKKENNVHLLKYESKKFVWKKSSGSISALFDYRDDNLDTYYIELNHTLNKLPVIELNNKMIIISGDVGSGKSVYLYDLAERLYTESSLPLWVVQVNLNSTSFLPYKNVIIKDNYHALWIISELLKLDKFQQKMFIMSGLGLLKLQVTILFDNFDKLLPDHDSFISLLKHLQTTHISNIYISVRLDSCLKLEQKLETFSYRLNSLTHNEKREFLIKYWAQKLEVNDEQMKKLHECAEYLLFAYSENCKLMLYPLQLKLLANIYAQSVREKTLNSDFTIVPFQDYYGLYNSFIRSQHVRSTDVSKLVKASLKKLLNVEEYKHCGFNDENFIHVSIPELNHITFMEYFAADWLVNQCNSEGPYTTTIFECIERLVTKTSDVFLDCIVNLFCVNSCQSLQSLVTFLAQSGHINLLKILIHRRSYDDSTEKTALHIAVENNNSQVLRILLNNYSDLKTIYVIFNGDFLCPDYANSKLVKYVNKKYQGKNALQIAESNNNVEIACDLLLAGANIDLVNKKFVQMIALYILTEISVEPSWSHKLWPLAEKLLRIVPESINQLTKEMGYSNLLNYFFAHGRIQIIKILFQVLENKINRFELMTENSKGMTPLDYMNGSAILKDEERLEMSKFIIMETGLQPNKKNKKILGSILEAAIKFEHLKTFEYFIDQYPDGYIGLLKFALQTNNINILEFLMRNNQRSIDSQTGNTALQIAIRLGVSPRVIKFLVDKGGINSTNNMGESVLCVAIKKGVDFKIIKRLIEQGANINAEDKTGLFPWCYAILSETTRYNAEEQLNFMHYLLTEGHCKIMLPVARYKSYLYDKWREELLKKYEFFCNINSYNLNYAETDGCLRLHLAIKSNDLIWCNFLINYGADVNICDSEGQTALHIAIYNNRYQAAKLLLENGAIFDIQDRNKQTPLDILTHMNCTSKESQELYKILNTATLFFSGKQLITPLTKYFPIVKGDPEISFMCCVLGCRNSKGQNLLHICVNNNNEGAFKELIKFGNICSERYLNFCGLNVNLQDFEGNTPMHLAARQGHLRFIGKLTNEGACFEIKNIAQLTPINLSISNIKLTQLLNSVSILFKVVKNNDFKKMKSYLDLEPLLLNARDVSGKMLLHCAVGLQKSLIAKYLIGDQNSKVNAPDLNGRTPLHYSVEADNIECVKALLKAGAQIDTKDKQGQRAFDLGNKENKSAEMLKAIYKLFVDIKDENPNIILNEEPRIFIDYLSSLETVYKIDRDIVINTRDWKKNSLLHYAVKFDYVNIAVVLLKNGSIYNSKNKMKQRPVDFAISTTQLFRSVDTIFKYLDIKLWNDSVVDREILIKCRDIGGNTLLHLSVKSRRIPEIKWLLKLGADINMSNNKDSSVLSYAKKYPKIIDLLTKTF